MKTDSIFYRLFAVYPASFFELVGLPAEETQSYRFDSVEVKQTAFRIDGVFLPLGPQHPILFCEVQFQSDPNLYKRLFSEIFLYLRHESSTVTWRAVVLFARRSIEPSNRINYQPLLDSPYVQRLYLDELEEKEETLGVGRVRLAIESEEAAGDRARQLLARAQQVTDAVLRREIVELIEIVLVYKFPRLSREEIEAMLGLSDLKQTKVYQEALAEGREEGREEGIHQGLLQVAREMLANGMSVDRVSQLTKLSREEVLQLEQSIAEG
ncbi:Rpn family recombination-promoting nuclease/putative transposase [Synechococcus sp. PCC 7336]|uniref:Rpn family recombination-promoting nuclease/putative transposase n=1 Tax=Synechococcus sp. PCC 7336 TaxID=195250 RepID=UPI0003464663|nr:Rpn family recombination-promoting nuclease/putative transposase [Synechococcus sp. PCC 7336]